MKRSRHAAQPGDEFQHLPSRWDARLEARLVTLHPGDYYVAEKGELIGTLLGSCVSACIRDTRLGIGGMNHFMLPVDGSTVDQGRPQVVGAGTRYGNVAMGILIDGILRRGGRRSDMEVKLVGGARVLDLRMDIGARNVAFVRDYARAQGFRVLAEDLGGRHPRKVIYDSRSGTVRVRQLARTERLYMANDERHYLERIDHALAGRVKLLED
jgi:chemotaxis protein CheD